MILMARISFSTLLVSLSLLTMGCGGRTMDNPGYPNNRNMSNNSNNNSNINNSNNNSNINTNTNSECQTPDDCVLAVKWDECCSCPVPASQQDLAADECLIPMEQSYVPQKCFVDCPAIVCPFCAGSGNSVTCSLGQCDWAAGHCVDDTDCVPAVRVDSCCEQAFPATLEEVEDDPCLVHWPVWWSDIPSECMDLWPPECDLIDCMPNGPPTRSMVCIENMCNYIPECDQVDDCTHLVYHRQCCPCPEAWPSSMMGHDPCLLPPNIACPQSCIPADCAGVLCEMCPDPPPIGCDQQTCNSYWWEY